VCWFVLGVPQPRNFCCSQKFRHMVEYPLLSISLGFTKIHECIAFIELQMEFVDIPRLVIKHISMHAAYLIHIWPHSCFVHLYITICMMWHDTTPHTNMGKWGKCNKADMLNHQPLGHADLISIGILCIHTSNFSENE